MRIGALILGILGGLAALTLGILGFLIGTLAEADKSGDSEGLIIYSVVLPIVALVGAGVVTAKPVLGSVLMALVAVMICLLIGLNILSLAPVSLLSVGAFLGFFSRKETKNKQTLPLEEK